jgi:hypothetical protein
MRILYYLDSFDVDWDPEIEIEAIVVIDMTDMLGEHPGKALIAWILLP